MKAPKKLKQDTRLIVHTFAELKECRLSDSQRMLVKGMQKYFRQTGTLSERQLQTLLEIQQYSDGAI